MLTPIDIDNKSFKKTKIGGYDIQDVEDFLVEVMDDYETLYKENADLKEKVNSAEKKASDLEESLMYYKTIEDGVTLTVENAKKTAEEIKEMAAKEAEAIKKDTEIEAKKQLEEIKLEIKSKQIEFEEIKKQIQIYKIKVNSMLEAQMKILNDED